MFSNRCREHLNVADETALQQMWQPLEVVIKLQLLVPVVIVYAIAPGRFTNTVLTR